MSHLMTGQKYLENNVLSEKGIFSYSYFCTLNNYPREEWICIRKFSSLTHHWIDPAWIGIIH